MSDSVIECVPVSATSRLGLLSGNGPLPLICLKEARNRGTRAIIVAHEDETPSDISEMAPDTTWIKIGELGKIIARFKDTSVSQVIMVGGIAGVKDPRKIKLDGRGEKFVAKLPNLRPDTVLRSVAQELEDEGITVIPCAEFLHNLLQQKEEILTDKKPDKQQKKDILFGIEYLKDDNVSRYDIGQCVIVKDGQIIAVEAIEGTNAAIRRSGKYGGPGTVVVKTAKPNQDKRFDLPVVGPDTIDEMYKAGASVLAIEAGTTIIVEKQKMVDIANTYGVSIITCSEAAML